MSDYNIENKLEDGLDRGEKFNNLEKLNLQESLIHRSLGDLNIKSEHKSDLAEIKEEVEQDVVEQEDSVEEWEDMIDEILPDLDDIYVDNCLDELRRLRLSHGFLRDVNDIKSLLKKSNVIYLEQKNGSLSLGNTIKINWKNKNNLENIDGFSEIFHLQILDDVLHQIEGSDESISDSDVFAMLVFLAEEYEKLEEEKKKKLIFWIEKKIALIKEGKLLEVYEIQVSDGGTITIKGQMGGKNITIVYKPGSDEFEIN